MINDPIKDIEERLLPIEAKQPFYWFDYRYYYKKDWKREPISWYAKNTQDLISKLKEHEIVGQLNTREVTEKRFMFKELTKELIERLDKIFIEHLHEHNPNDYVWRRKRNHYLWEREKYLNTITQKM